MAEQTAIPESKSGSSAPNVLNFDYRKQPVGYFWGGKFGKSVACPKCKKPALLGKVTVGRKGENRGKLMARYVHTAKLVNEVRKTKRDLFYEELMSCVVKEGDHGT